MRLDLNYGNNDACKKGCNRKDRRDLTENDICIETNSIIDDLPVRCVGEWSLEKIYHLVQYFNIFSKGMKDKWAGEIYYIEICSGPGRCISRSQGLEFDGTSLSIIKSESYKHLRRALFFDHNSSVVDILNQRIHNLSIQNAIAFSGNYYEPQDICKTIRDYINPYGLSLVFVDPTDCSVPFDLISKISNTLKNVDFIINIAYGTDFTRNICNALLKQDNYIKSVTKYSRFLGSAEYFRDPVNIKLAYEKNHNELRANFREGYIKRLKAIGYEYFDFKPIKHYYYVLFASKHPKGLTFWEKANNISFDGQRQLF